MKRILSVLILAVLVFSLASCGDDSVPDGMKLASDTSIVDYSLFVPESWIIDYQEGYSMAHVSDADQSSVIVMQWNMSDAYGNFDAWFEEFSSQLELSFSDISFLTENEGDLLGSDQTPAKAYVYTASLANTGIYYKYKTVAAFHGGSVYVMTFTFIQDEGEGTLTYSSFDNSQETMEQIINSFRFN